MKKVISILVCLVFVLALFTACSSSNDKSADTAAPGNDNPVTAVPADSGKTYTLKMAHHLNPDHEEARAFQAIADLVAERTDGRLTITIFPSSQMGSEREVDEMVQMGTVDIGISDGATWATVLGVDELAVWSLPFMYANTDGQRAIMESEYFIPAAEPYFLQAGVRPLWAVGSDIRGTMTVDKPIQTADDVVGLKIRIPEINLYAQLWKALGANPTTTPMSEAYTALSQGVVDGVELGPNTIINYNLQEVCKYFTLTGHMASTRFISVNDANWQKIPEDLRNTMLEVVDELWDAQFEHHVVAYEETLQQMRDAGVEILELSAGEREKMIEKCAPIYQTYRDMGLSDLVDKLLELGAG